MYRGGPSADRRNLAVVVDRLPSRCPIVGRLATGREQNLGASRRCPGGQGACDEDPAFLGPIRPSRFERRRSSLRRMARFAGAALCFAAAVCCWRWTARMKASLCSGGRCASAAYRAATAKGLCWGRGWLLDVCIDDLSSSKWRPVPVAGARPLSFSTLRPITAARLQAARRCRGAQRAPEHRSSPG